MTTPTEKWTALGSLAAAITITAKKIFTAKTKPKPEFISRLEFHQQMDAVRDRIAAGYLALGDKLDAKHRELLSALDLQRTTFETRLDQLDTRVARLDERTAPPQALIGLSPIENRKSKIKNPMRQGTAFEHRLDTLETNLARLDERVGARKR